MERSEVYFQYLHGKQQNNRQSISTNEPISQENLSMIMQEIQRRGCMGIGSIHWDEMSIKQGVALCKRTGELVGFEDDIPHEMNQTLEELLEDEDSHKENERFEDLDEDSDVCDLSSQDLSQDSSDQELPYIHNKKSQANMSILFFFS